MADLELVQDDTYPTRFQVSDAAGPVSLTGATVKLFLKSSSPALLVTVNCTPDADQTANKGWATVPWGATDLGTAATYDAEAQVTFADGKKATFPTAAPKSVSVRADLGD